MNKDNKELKDQQLVSAVGGGRKDAAVTHYLSKIPQELEVRW